LKKIVAFVGSARKKHTQNAVEQFMSNLQSLGDVQYEIVRLCDQHLDVCRGCKLCLDRGEELCRLKDDRDLLIEKMITADGVIFATPNYSFQVSAITKIFLDRLGFVFHRPRFFGKAFTSIVVQGIYGGPKIVKYLDFIGNGLGFNTVKGSCITTREPITDKQQRKNDAVLAAHSNCFYNRVMRPSYPSPTLFKLMIFRWSRTSIKLMLDESFRDYTYYRDNGWFESDYYYPARLNPIKRLAGSLIDRIIAKTTKHS
jgi:multimeric flavodoxin WrbA